MLRNRLYFAVVSGHFVIDTLNGLGPVLLAVLAIPLGLTNAQIGFALTLYLLSNALTQPLFGWLSDRAGHRAVLLAGLGVVWVALFFCGIAMVSSWPVLLLLFFLAPLGSGLFHPIGTASAATAHPDRANSATAVFFLFGQMGLALGPALGGLLLGSVGVLGVLPLALLALVPAGLLFVARNDPPAAQVPPVALAAAESTPAAKPQPQPTRPGRWLWLAIGAFVLLIAVRSSMQTAYQSFLPKLFADYGWEPALYGLLAGIFMGASAIGNVIMGGLADRFGMRVVTVVPLVLSVPAGLLCLADPSLLVTFVAAALAGILIGGSHSVLVVHAQRLLPTGRQFAAGLILGFTFASGAGGAWLVGFAADVYGLPLVMRVVTGLGVLAALLALTLPGRQPTQPTSATSTPPVTEPSAEALEGGSVASRGA